MKARLSLFDVGLVPSYWILQVKDIFVAKCELKHEEDWFHLAPLNVVMK